MTSERYNRTRRHSHCANQAPVTFETRTASQRNLLAALERAA